MRPLPRGPAVWSAFSSSRISQPVFAARSNKPRQQGKGISMCTLALGLINMQLWGLVIGDLVRIRALSDMVGFEMQPSEPWIPSVAPWHGPGRFRKRRGRL